MRFSSSARRKPRRLAVVALLLCVAAGGCEMKVRVAMDVQADGRGHVEATFTLDRAAAREVGDLEGELRVDDLVDAGWTIDGPERTRSGGIVVTARKPFDGPRGAARAVEELSGDGPFRDFRVERDASFLKTRTRFSGTVDLQAGLEAFGDEQLRERLGEPLGVDAEELRRRAGAALSEVFGFEVVVRLPGDVESNAPTRAGNGAVWRPKLGEDVRLNASAEQWNAASIGFAALATFTGVAALLVAWRQLRSRSRSREVRRRGGPSVSTGGASSR